MKKNHFIMLLAFTCCIFTYLPIAASAKVTNQLLDDITVYKVRRGPTVSQDVILKSFTVHKGRVVHAKYVNKEGGWELSADTFHSGKYVYYFALSNKWAKVDDNIIELSAKTGKTSWTRKGNSKAWVWSKPGSGYKKFNISKFKHTIWKTDKEAQLYYHGKALYFHIYNGKHNGWIKTTAIKYAPHKEFTITAKKNNGIGPLNADGGRAYPLTTEYSTRAIRFNNSPSVFWVSIGKPSGFDAKFNSANLFALNIAAKDVKIIK